MNISFIVICMDNFFDFKKTFHSLIHLVDSNNELIVVDSSSNKEIKFFLDEFLSPNISYYYCKPSGIYPAQNFGIIKSNNEYIQIINSGDVLIDNGYKEQLSSLSHAKKDVYVFNQFCSYNNEIMYEYKPDNQSIWPHQSLIYKRNLHEKYGLYSTKYKIISDQLFFKLIRNEISFEVVNKPLTIYDLSGVSSKLSFVLIKEKFILDNEFNNSLVSTIKLLVFVFFSLLSLILSEYKVIKIKDWIRSFNGYLC